MIPSANLLFQLILHFACSIWICCTARVVKTAQTNVNCSNKLHCDESEIFVKEVGKVDLGKKNQTNMVPIAR